MNKPYLEWYSDKVIPHKEYTAEFGHFWVQLIEKDHGQYDLEVMIEDRDELLTTTTLQADQFEQAFLEAEEWLRAWAGRLRRSLGPSEEQVDLNTRLCSIFQDWGKSRGEDIDVSPVSNFRSLIDYVTERLEETGQGEGESGKLIGNLLDTWDGLPNDVKSADPELEIIAACISEIYDSIDNDKFWSAPVKVKT